MSALSVYRGHLLPANECHALDAQGLPCQRETVVTAPIPLCEYDAATLALQLRVAVRMFEQARRAGGPRPTEYVEEGT